jgi:flagellar biogenesis protein FliO
MKELRQNCFKTIAASIAPLLLWGFTLAAETGETSPPAGFDSPSLFFSLVRVFGALAVVAALFLGGVWLFRNWQRIVLQKGRPPRLSVQEIRSLGARHALYVVGYEQQRFLLSTSPSGVTLLTHLPETDKEDEVAPVAPPTFADTLFRAVARR